MKLQLLQKAYDIVRYPRMGWRDVLMDATRFEHDELFSFTLTDDECSLVVPSGAMDSDDCEARFRAVRVAGQLEFTLTGVLFELCGVLAQAGIPIFAVSTFTTDYILFAEERVTDACAALELAGHQIEEVG